MRLIKIVITTFNEDINPTQGLLKIYQSNLVKKNTFKKYASFPYIFIESRVYFLYNYPALNAGLRYRGLQIQKMNQLLLFIYTIWYI